VNIVPVVFEDHGLAGMRPVAWSTPVFEIRCGMFNTRERVGRTAPGGGGILLGRSFLAGLNRAAGWTWGTQALEQAKPDDRFLFLNGLLAPDFLLINELFRLAEEGNPFVWHDQDGLVAALVDGRQAAHLAADWKAWEEGCAASGLWHDPGRALPAWRADLPDCPPLAEDKLGDLPARQSGAPRFVWSIVPATSRALAGDLDHALNGAPFRREPFGIFPLDEKDASVWDGATQLRNLAEAMATDDMDPALADNRGRIYCGSDVSFAPDTAFNTEAGPVILDNGVTVMPHCYLEGPLYIGPGSLVKPGTRIHGETSLGMVNRVAGEIGESTFGDFANKQHEGFIGHAVLGSWINLGAMTTCSDLKNNYGEIRVDLGYGELATGSRFVGLLMGDHAKTAIGTLFNTGTSVGFGTNIFGGGMPPKMVGNFRWGGAPGCPDYAVDRAAATAEVVMSRRGCTFTDAHRGLFQLLAG
jgi:hypothetical protein